MRQARRGKAPADVKQTRRQKPLLLSRLLLMVLLLLQRVVAIHKPTHVGNVGRRWRRSTAVVAVVRACSGAEVVAVATIAVG
jgi:hypothetical protein